MLSLEHLEICCFQMWPPKMSELLTIPIGTLQWRHNGRDGVSNHQPHDCLLNRLFRLRSKKTSKLRVFGLCAWNYRGTGEFPAQMSSNAGNVSIWWRHHAIFICRCMSKNKSVRSGFLLLTRRPWVIVILIVVFSLQVFLYNYSQAVALVPHHAYR